MLYMLRPCVSCILCTTYIHRVSTSVAKPSVQVVTHLCYSDFQDIMAAVDAMDGKQQIILHDAVLSL